MTSSSNDGPKLPQDVVEEILKRLPVESLLRCRCVCRSWRSTIDDPRFVALHLNRSALDPSNWYLVCLDWCDPLQYMCFLFPIESLTLPSQSQIEIPFVTPPNCYRFVGSCNGLICATEISGKGYGRTMYLWNLFTRKHKAVRRSGPGHHLFHLETAYEALGFGFDARSNDYKIVRILYLLDGNRGCFGGTKPGVEVYSLSTDSWRSLECEVPAFCDDGVFLNGNLHWFASKLDLLWDEGKYASIVLFDVADEVFDEMAVPEEIFQVDGACFVASLAVLNDLLAVFFGRGHFGLPSICSVWVMRDYGVPESWTKLYSFEACGPVVGFDGFTRNGEILMEMNNGERLTWNPITSQYANLPLSMECELVSVVESLVSL